MFKRKILSILLTAALVLPISPFGVGTVFAATDGDFLIPRAEMDAPAADSIAISDRAGLEAIKNNLSGKYHLTADIDLSGGEWVPIGTSSNNAFSGIFDGQGHVIRKLKITGNTYQYNGLFGNVDTATIKNVGLVDTDISVNSSSNSSSYAGGLIGYGIGSPSGVLSVSNCYNTGDVTANASSAGGLIGSASISSSVSSSGVVSVSNCYNTGDVTSSTASVYSSNVGGIIGFSCASVSNCYNTGDVTSSASSSSSSAGGIIGYVSISSRSVSVSNCNNTGDVTSTSSSASDSNAGGIIGHGSVVVSVSNCYNAGNVSASGSNYTYAGGIVGDSFHVPVGSCVVLSARIAAENTGGVAAHAYAYMIGYNSNDNGVTKTNNHAITGDIAGNPIDDTGNGNGGARITAEQSRNKDTYTALGWDFDGIWNIDPALNGGLPFLRGTDEAPQTFTITATAGANGAISPSGNVTVTSGGAVTFTVTPNSGYTISDVKADGNSVLAQTDAGKYTFDKVTTDHAIAATFAYSGGGSYTGGSGGSSGGTTPAAGTDNEKPADEAATSTPPSGQTAVSQFNDVASHWAAEAIAFVVSRGLFNGVSETEFAPNAPMTRAMFATVLARYAKGTAAGSASFSDVPAGQWYTDGVLWAAENGIVSGTGSGLFDPNGNITREQLAVMLYNYAKFAGLDVSAAAGLADFPDGADLSAWARDAAAWAVATGLISGKPGGLLDPKGPATRAEVATILQRFIEN